jgi:NADH-quinone oxidoreductase subunit N
MFITDSFAVFFKLLFLGAAGWVFLVKRETPSEKISEFRLILWSALLGMFFLVSARNFLLFFIALEILTLSLYVLASYSNVGAIYESPLRPIEAGLKYLVMGSLASAFLLYGISLIYASSGSLSFGNLGGAFGQKGNPLLFLAGALLVLSALGFKVAAVPFHVWVPDVYQGAPTPVVGFFSVASKAAGFAALLRILSEAFGRLADERQILFSVLAALTLLYGNLGALVQKDIKRLLGYSSIGHAGFLLMAVAASKPHGEPALLYYLIAYGATNLAAFLVVAMVERAEGSQAIEAFQGLSKRSPFLAAGMFVALLSLAGVPPLGGFFAKFYVLLATAKKEIFWLVILGAVNVAISLYYYLSVVRVMYFEKPKTEIPIAVSLPASLLLFGLIAAIVLVGVWQAPFFRITSQAAMSLF